MTFGLGVVPSGSRGPTETTMPHLLPFVAVGFLQLVCVPDQFEVVGAQISAVGRGCICFSLSLDAESASADSTFTVSIISNPLALSSSDFESSGDNEHSGGSSPGNKVHWHELQRNEMDRGRGRRRFLGQMQGIRLKVTNCHTCLFAWMIG